ncbi:MAG: hypothetical protein SH868_00060 [Bythopirellula sp.]|nr:hypothetical protein [Bythopirellula sp.]
MSNSLLIYLHDHLAGSRFALNLLESLREDRENAALCTLAEELIDEIEQDRQILEQLADKIGKPQNNMKEGAAWLAQKASLWKLGHDGTSLGTFEALETLSLGIMGKLALWRALRVLQPTEPILFETDFEHLCKRAELQFFHVEQLRIEMVPLVFSSESEIAVVG